MFAKIFRIIGYNKHKFRYLKFAQDLAPLVYFVSLGYCTKKFKDLKILIFNHLKVKYSYAIRWRLMTQYVFRCLKLIFILYSMLFSSLGKDRRCKGFFWCLSECELLRVTVKGTVVSLH